jgi:hypothetical protein
MAEMKWTSDAPKADGSYWWRHDETDPAWDVHLVKDGCFEYCGREGRITVSTFGGEWLGPITPAHVFTQTDLDTAVAAARGEVERLKLRIEEQICSCCAAALKDFPTVGEDTQEKGTT